MFKSCVLYRAEGDLPASAAELETAMESAQFQPLGATQAGTGGWVPPRAEHGPLVERIGGHWILKMQTEARVVPAAFVKRELKQRLDQVEKETGRRPKGKAAREFKDELVRELMPRAFPKQGGMLVWINPLTRLIAIDAGTHKRADHAVELLAHACPTANITQVSTETSPAAAMSAWLSAGEAPAEWSVDREGLLQSLDDKSAVKFTRVEMLNAEDVRLRLREGMAATSLALTFRGRVSLTLTHKLQLKAIQVLDVAMEAGKSAEAAADGFDADVAIMTGELVPLIDSLLADLGGISILPIMAAAAGSESDKDAPPPHAGDGPDPLYAQACAILQSEGRASISTVQRHLRIGYNRAACLLEDMERVGIVSPMDNRGHRNVLVTA